MLGGILLSLHNTRYLLDLMARARQAILDGRYGAFMAEYRDRLDGRRDF